MSRWLAVRTAADGLICLTGGPRGPIGSAIKAGHAELAETRLLTLKQMFGDRLYVEIERVAGYDRADRGRRPSSSPTATNCRSSRPTRRSFRRATITRRMTR